MNDFDDLLVIKPQNNDDFVVIKPKVNDFVAIKPKPKPEKVKEKVQIDYPEQLAWMKNVKPSTFQGLPWMAVPAKTNTCKDEYTAGKWMLFCSNDQIDALWEKIAIATINDQLGYGSKVSTNMMQSLTKVICVYTTNDETEIMRVRDALRKLGITRKIPYKTNQTTLSGNYANNGKRVSKYYV
jgi:hypothetical protein